MYDLHPKKLAETPHKFYTSIRIKAVAPDKIVDLQLGRR